jgi:hypothetical protein
VSSGWDLEGNVDDQTVAQTLQVMQCTIGPQIVAVPRPTAASRVTYAAALFILEPERADELAEPVGLFSKEGVKFVGRHVPGLRTNGCEEGANIRLG